MVRGFSGFLLAPLCPGHHVLHTIDIPAQNLFRLVASAAIIFLLVVLGASATYVVEPGHRGVEVILGRVSAGFKPEGFGFKLPVDLTVVSRN